MRTKVAITLAMILGIFSYSLPLYAESKEYHVEEKTVIDIPVVGKIETKTSSYLSGCKLKETTSIKLHNALVKMMSDSDGKSMDVQLSNLCDEIQWKYDEGSETFTSLSFDEIRNNRYEDDEDSDIQNDMDSDQNDIDELPKMKREILGYEKNINGFKARKVVTTVYPEDSDNIIVVEEYYTNDSNALSKITRARKDLNEKLGYDDSHVEGVPTMVDLIYKEIKADTNWSRPEGEVVRFVIRLVDEDEDEMFTMKYDVIEAETTHYQENHFTLR